MYRIFKESLENYFKYHEKDCYCYKIGAIFKILANPDLYRQLKEQGNYIVKDVDNVVYWIAKKQDSVHHFQFFSHVLWSEDFQAVKDDDCDTQMLEDRLAELELILDFRYWF